VNVDVTMPQLGETVAEGTVTRWLHQVGDEVGDQEPLLEISTDKVDTEVPSPAAGTLLEIRVLEDQTVAVGTVLAVLGSSQAVSAGGLAAPAASGAAARRGLATSTGRRHRHSPRVRRLAAASGVEVDHVVGSGPSGRVTPHDVHRAAEQLVHSNAGAMALSVAERMPTSVHSTARSTSVVEVDVTAVVAPCERRAADVLARQGVRLTLTAFFGKAVLEALGALPRLNASIEADGRTVVQHARRHLGIAVDTDQGLMVPVVRDADDLNLVGLSRRIAELAELTRNGALGPEDVTGGTFTLSDTGSRGALWDTPILVPGQVGILGGGAVVERPVVLRRPDGERVIGIRSMVYLALTYDHRLVDGADAARFLATVKARLGAGRFDDDLA
jgi:2-oxoglutarate dehydrogenase E2 component (dihydrolipoamide succinyltransferase)